MRKKEMKVKLRKRYTDIVAGVCGGGAAVVERFIANPFEVIKVLKKHFKTTDHGMK